MLLYHGAPRKIIQIQAVPEYQKQQNYIGDFGTGFYLTQDKDFASERALIARDEEAYLYTYNIKEDIFSDLPYCARRRSISVHIQHQRRYFLRSPCF